MSSLIQEESILKDYSTFKLDFTKESGLNEIVNSLEYFKSVSNSANILESEDDSYKMIRVITIANELMVNQIKEAVTTILKDNRYVPIANLYIWLLNKYKTIR